ncbi:Fur family transcriptional regulator [Chitinispirillales bacterium ANBcel5]|uniref:Fur family transcriptional regulator n=1 Tax=Cellulosispirillum alkaliphilum TaxID=3039283 RepID=UPI002A543D08|nr:Fur family transcriptional regulator [Chitinispirillales bacterium ANBcel5]
MNRSPLIGERRTKQRKAIIAYLRYAMKPLTAEEVFDGLCREFDNLSLSTVYRNLKKLQRSGFISAVKRQFENSTRYTLSDSSHVHHFVCRHCMKTIPLNFCPLEAIKEKVDEDAFKIEGHSFELYGSCVDCINL